MIFFPYPIFYQGTAVVHEIAATYQDQPTPADYQPLPVARVPMFESSVAVVHEILSTYTDQPTPASFGFWLALRKPFFEGDWVRSNAEPPDVVAPTAAGGEEQALPQVPIFRDWWSWPSYYSVSHMGILGSIVATGIIMVYLPERTLEAEVRGRMLEGFLPERTLDVELRQGGRQRA